MSDNQHNELTERAAELVGEISEHVREGNPGRAESAFRRGWRDSVPELPLRFSVVLVRPDRDVVSAIHRLINDGSEPELTLQREDNNLVLVMMTSGERVGNLPALDSRLLLEFGDDADLYRPQVLEIRYDDNGRFDYIAVELVRPEVRYCTSCGEKHDGPHANCAKCRGKRRRVGEEVYEAPPINFHEALDVIVTDQDDADGLGI